VTLDLKASDVKKNTILKQKLIKLNFCEKKYKFLHQNKNQYFRFSFFAIMLLINFM